MSTFHIKPWNEFPLCANRPLFPNHVLVNPVNCVGVCGAGLALVFKKLFPANYRMYHTHCKAGNMKPGGVFSTSRDVLIYNVATKDHWRDVSDLLTVSLCARNLYTTIVSQGLTTMHIPALGCGCGELGHAWDAVLLALMNPFLASKKDDWEIYFYRPKEAKS